MQKLVISFGTASCHYPAPAETSGYKIKQVDNSAEIAFVRRAYIHLIENHRQNTKGKKSSLQSILCGEFFTQSDLPMMIQEYNI